MFQRVRVESSWVAKVLPLGLNDRRDISSVWALRLWRSVTEACMMGKSDMKAGR